MHPCFGKVWFKRLIFSGCRSGEGDETFPNGDKYSGSWHSDLKHGFGTMIFANGELLIHLSSEIVKSLLCRPAYFWASAGTQYIGFWDKGVKSGAGKTLNYDGSRCVAAARPHCRLPAVQPRGLAEPNVFPK
jgi:hypothetical protein